MSFLAPLFLLGAAAVALPVLFHLIRQTTKERTKFSSLIFLSPTPPRLTRRSRLEDILLLILRSAVVCLLAFGFARPFLRNPVSAAPAAEGARRIIVLVDTSASMQRSGLWAAAMEKATAVLRKANAQDEVAVFTFDRGVVPLISFEQWSQTAPRERFAVAEQLLAKRKPGWSSTRIGSALMSSADLLAEAYERNASYQKHIVLITDLQEGGKIEALQGYTWPKDVKVDLETVSVPRRSNASIQLLPGADEADTKSPNGARVRVSNAPDSRKEQFQLGWAGPAVSTFVGKPMDIHVPPGQTRTVLLPFSASASNAPTPVRILLAGDEEPFDNAVFVGAPLKTEVRVAYLGAESGADPKSALFFLTNAFQDTRMMSVRVNAKAPDGAFTTSDIQKSTLLIIAGQLSSENEKAVREAVAAGKTALLVLRSPSMRDTAASLLGDQSLRLEEAKVPNYTIFSEIDFRNPLFTPFSEARFSDFSKIRFWRYRRIAPEPPSGARILARFDTGDAALMEVPIQKGRVLVLASGWQPEDSQLALSTKFVPLLYSLLEETRSVPVVPDQYLVGDVLRRSSFAREQSIPVSIINPDGVRSDLPAADTDFGGTAIPGVCSVIVGSSTNSFAVNLDPAESRLSPIHPDDLERLGVPMNMSSQASKGILAARAERLRNSELENRQKLWRWVILTAVAVLLVETWLSGRTARRIVVQST